MREILAGTAGGRGTAGAVCGAGRGRAPPPQPDGGRVRPSAGRIPLLEKRGFLALCQESAPGQDDRDPALADPATGPAGSLLERAGLAIRHRIYATESSGLYSIIFFGAGADHLSCFSVWGWI